MQQHFQICPTDLLRYNDIVGEKIIVQDSMKRIKWKITDEYREIAGYNCRRANGITPDSIYVIDITAMKFDQWWPRVHQWSSRNDFRLGCT
jgi:GLPGLI family protein